MKIIRRKIIRKSLVGGYRGHLSTWIELECGHNQQFDRDMRPLHTLPKTTICCQCTKAAREKSQSAS